MIGHAYLAVDLGAGSGRVLLGRFTAGSLQLDELHRFEQPVVNEAGHERWDLESITQEVLAGLVAARDEDVRSVGVDSWAVDYGLLDADDRLLANPVCYRDPRTDGMLNELQRRMPAEEIYQRTGIQFLPFNTVVQLLAQVDGGEWPAEARRLLMIPDLVHLRLCGVVTGEYSNASSTQLLDARSKTWDSALLEAVGVSPLIMPPLVMPGTKLGPLLPDLVERTGLAGLEVVAPATHDTASAVVGTPLQAGCAYFSSGTWSLLGVELAEPLLTDGAREHNFTNEGGAFGTVRFLKNVMGLWLLESCRRIWEAHGNPVSHEELQAQLTGEGPGDTFLQPDDLRFLHPDDMVAEIHGHLQATGQQGPVESIALARVILESLALRYAQVVDLLERVTGESIQAIHVVGGGCQNDFLNQATANATGRTVYAGPVEATAIGNLLVQAIVDDVFPDVATARSFVANTMPRREFVPRQQELWVKARERFARLG